MLVYSFPSPFSFSVSFPLFIYLPSLTYISKSVFWYRYQWQWVAIEEIYPITNIYRPCFIDLSGGLP